MDKKYNSIVIHNRLYGKKKKSQKWFPYIEEFIKKPKAIEYTDFFHQLPDGWKVYIKDSKNPAQALAKIYQALKKEASTGNNVRYLDRTKHNHDKYPILDYEPFLPGINENDLEEYNFLLDTEGGDLQ